MSDFEYEAKAKKVLGNSGKLPKAPVDPHVAVQQANKAIEALSKQVEVFKKGTGDLEKQLLEAQNKQSALRNTLKQYQSIVDGADFDLDEKKPDDKKKIDEAKKVMKQGLDGNIAKVDGILKTLDNVDQVLTHLQRLDTAKIC